MASSAQLDPAVLAFVRAGMSKVKVPHAQDKVFKDECLYTFDTPFTTTGLYVNLATWGGVGQDMLGFDSQRTGSTLYAHLRYTKVPVEAATEEEETKKATVLGIGVEGGFKLDSQKYDVVKEFALAALSAPGDVASLVEVPFPNLAIPEFVSTAVQAIIDHQGAASQTDEAIWLAEDEPRPVSKYAHELPQLDNGVKISADPASWKCAESGQAENLWLNLSTGYIGSGRPQLVNDKLIGTGAALKHFDETGRRYPLAVKLGTITPQGQGADVYSYAPDEDRMVTDPKLAEHLQHWGIDAMKMEKTDKSLAELEIESQKWAFSRITEAGAALTPLRGPGYVGLKNLGNSCYMNSVLQLLFTLPELRRQYLDRYDAIVKERAVADPASDVLTQTAKLALGLCSDRYSPAVTPEEVAAAAASKDSAFTQSVEPRMFKQLVGKGHPEFSSGRQQDAQEYLDHLLEILMKAERVGLGGQFYTAALFNFQVEDRLQCQGSGKVRYTTRKAAPQLHLSIPLEAATNLAEVAQYQERKQKRQKLAEETKAAGGNGNGGSTATIAPPQPVETASPHAPATAATPGVETEEANVVPVVPFEACLGGFAGPEVVKDYASPALPVNAPRTTALKTQSFKNFPPYLVVHLQRYYMDYNTWQGKKMEVSVPMPFELDLTQLRGQGQQPGEELLPDAPDSSAAAAAPAGPQPDERMAMQMADFGFSLNAAKRALVAVQNSSVDAAVAWLLEHTGDPDINDPPPDPSAAAAAAAGRTPADAYKAEAANLAGMLGFTEQQALAALTATNGSMERAADWLYSHMDGMDAAVAEVLGGATAGGAAACAGPAKELELGDGEGKYELVGFASHVGKNLGSGHYVAHIRKGGRWVIFDDQKVAESEHPPLDLGYLYLYRRRDGMEMD